MHLDTKEIGLFENSVLCGEGERYFVDEEAEYFEKGEFLNGELHGVREMRSRYFFVAGNSEKIKKQMNSEKLMFTNPIHLKEKFEHGVWMSGTICLTEENQFFRRYHDVKTKTIIGKMTYPHGFSIEGVFFKNTVV